jgi:SOS-response transcriptional repressor LexA
MYADLLPAGFASLMDGYKDKKLDINEYLVEYPSATFLIRVEGLSMKDAGILPGDMVLVDRSLTPVAGDIVIAEVDNEWTIKYFRKEGGLVFLEPANKRFPIIYPKEELKIAAVVKSVIRKY